MAASMKASKVFFLSVVKRCYSTEGGNGGRNLLTLKTRGFFQNIFPPNSEDKLSTALQHSAACMYCGFDPTSDSLHIGHLLPIMALIHCQQAGHKPIALIGGSTALVGDPSGQTHDRVTLSEEAVQHNVARIEASLQTIFTNYEDYIRTEYTPQHHIKILNNSEWYNNINLVDFLSKTGRHFRMGPMLNRHSVKSRLQSEEGMTLTEFTYQAFQAYDWLELHKTHNCILQIGGNDQTGNMLAGYELIGRESHTDVYSLTVPLVTTESGIKLGKSVGNCLWLDPAKTTAFELYQYFINFADSDVEKHLKLFTFLSDEEISDVMLQHNKKPEQRKAQKKLAEQITLLVHGQEGLATSLYWTSALIGKDAVSLQDLNQSDLLLLFKSTPCVDIPKDEEMTVLDVCMKAGCFDRIGDGRRVIKEGGVRVNHERVWSPDHVLTPQYILPTQITLLQIGKKSNFYVVRWQ